ncbi:hypothetical protein [Virgibacillus sp. L01]|uniref:hypothetical protein n=1 Tax=Virgibacillus sp. L01 TaxID=3457429 RepID=UPI003FCFAACA
MCKGEIDTIKNEGQLRNLNVGDKIYFEEYQSRYYSEEFYEKYVHDVEQCYLCADYICFFVPCLPLATDKASEKNGVFLDMVEELKKLTCPPSEMVIEEESIKCIWRLPILFNTQWLQSDEEAERFCKKMKDQFVDLRTCKLGFIGGFYDWYDDLGYMETIKEYMKEVYRINQLIDAMGLKISMK